MILRHMESFLLTKVQLVICRARVRSVLFDMGSLHAKRSKLDG